MPVLGSAIPVVLVVALVLSKAAGALQARGLAAVQGRVLVHALALALGALPGRVAHLFRVQFRIAHPIAGHQRPAEDHHKLAAQALMRERVEIRQNPVASTRKDHRIQMAIPALAGQTEKLVEQRAFEKPQVAMAARLDQSGPLAGLRDADYQSGSPAKVYFGLSGRRSTLNIPLFQVVANHRLINNIY